MNSEAHESGASTASDVDELGVLDLLIVLARHKWIMLGVPLAMAAAAALYSLQLPNIYVGTTKILPPQQNQAGAAIMFGQLLGAAPGAPSLGLKNPSDVYIAMLQSRTVADAMIRRFDLRTLYGTATMVDTRNALAAASAIRAGRDGIITVEVADTEPKRAAMLANGYVEELDKFTQNLAVTDAGQRRIYFEKQLKLAKDNLADAEVALKKTQERTGMIRLDDQGRAVIEAIARLRGQIAGKEVQLVAMRSFATESNPDIILTQQELGGLRSELQKLEKKTGGRNGDIFVPTGNVPELGLEYVRKLREVKYNETLFEVLARQFEMAKADEAKDNGVIQVIDRAVEPDRKSKPRRSFITMVAGFAGVVIAMVVVFLLEAWQRVRRDPAQLQRLDLLRSHLLSKR
jgi:tyrosine-protein kinase Etk/Wzc